MMLEMFSAVWNLDPVHSVTESGGNTGTQMECVEG